jgi:hypothetical protein
MRSRLPLLAFGLLLIPIGAMTLVSACGSTTDDSVTDAAKDGTTMDVAADVAPDVVAEAGCEAGSLTGLIPDGGIDADSGGIPLAACYGCFESQCSSQINTCNGDCSCRVSVIDLIDCVVQTGDFMTCGESALLSGDTNLQALIGCAYADCVQACTPAGDGGMVKDAAGDGD